MEMWAVSRSEPTPGIINHERRVMDGRARWMMSMIQSWGAAALIGDAVHDAAHSGNEGGGKPRDRPSKQDVVMLAAELVEAAWDEATHRGWIVDVPGLGEAQ